MKERLDTIVVRKGWSRSREESAELIRKGVIRVNALVRTDPSMRAEFDQVTGPDQEKTGRYVSRGGWKLKGALEFFNLSVRGRRIVDLGASTGGFTDCLLQEGVAAVWAVDVGKGLLDMTLRNDSRVTVVESANVRYAGEWMPDEEVDGVVVDLSFISLRQIFSSVEHLLRKGGWCLSLVKPQFEASPEQIDRGGIVRSAVARKEILRSLIRDFSGFGTEVKGVVPSSLRGRKGNQEYFVLTHWKGTA
jgi:23S rRNA (cytidine1920-2'-O)/16S rRNA (cytidine1409-2'-O)-methyltransferase